MKKTRLDEKRTVPIGTRIKFVKTLTCGATEDHPPFLYAWEGDEGVVVSHDCYEGHMVKWDHWNEPFGSVIDEEFIEIDNTTEE